MKTKLKIIGALSAVGIASSISLSLLFYNLREGTAGFKSFCNVSAVMNCDMVASTKYAEFFGGIPLSSMTAGWFFGLLILTLFAHSGAWKREAIRIGFGMSVIGAVASVIYLSIMALTLKTYCLMCLAIDAVNFLSLGLFWSMREDSSKSSPPDFAKWRVLLGILVGCLVITPALMRSGDSEASHRAEINDVVDSVMASPQLPMQLTGELPILGDKNAPVTIVEYSDFQCPFCRNGAFIMNSVLNRYPGKVRVVYKYFPLDPSCNRSIQRKVHDAACEAAKVSYCASVVGKFAPVYESLFDKQSELAPGMPEKIAIAQGLDEKALTTCVNSPEALAKVTKDIEEGLQLGVQSTPTFFINGRKVEGAYPVPAWEIMVDRLLAQH